MSTIRSNPVRNLFDRCLPLPAAERVGLLERECAGDPSLQARVLALLAHVDAPCPALDDGVQALAAGLLGAVDPSPPRSAVGAYRLLRELGRGGMGTVWLAQRQQDQFEQLVALKLISAEPDDRAANARFLREREILASLRHPNIAQLVDGGVTDDGQPWYAMEYVEGEPLNAWCDSRALGLHARVGLLRGICEAVHFAHQNLIVHRDLKPANILIDRHGIPKLLDFGIAKPLRECAQALTGADTRLMTPEYAAPEQVTGGAITTATDIHALGVVLFETITGMRPFQAHTDNPFALQKAIVETPAPHLSGAFTGGSTTALREQRKAAAKKRGSAVRDYARHLRGDLDRIVQACLAKDPRERYASAAQLSADLCRYLDGLPVQIAEDGWWYRSWRFVRRHAVAVAASALVAIALLSATAVSLQQARAARIAAAEAENRTFAARATADLFHNLFTARYFRPKNGGPAPATDLLVVAAVGAEKWLSSSPAELAEFDVGIARSWRAAGEARQAAVLYRRALAVLPLDIRDATVNRLELTLDLGEAELAAGDLTAARATLQALQPGLAAASENAVPLRHRSLVLAARIALAERRFSDAERLAQQALQSASTASGGHGARYARTLVLQAQIWFAQHRPDQAAQAIIEAAGIWSRDTTSSYSVADLDASVPLAVLIALDHSTETAAFARHWRDTWSARLGAGDEQIGRIDQSLSTVHWSESAAGDPLLVEQMRSACAAWLALLARAPGPEADVDFLMGAP